MQRKAGRNLWKLTVPVQTGRMRIREILLQKSRLTVWNRKREKLRKRQRSGKIRKKKRQGNRKAQGIWKNQKKRKIQRNLRTKRTLGNPGQRGQKMRRLRKREILIERENRRGRQI